GPVWAGIGSFVTGIGMGLTSTTFIVAIQNHVSWKTRGIATASNMFMRMIGSSLGAALLGGILNAQLNEYLQKVGWQIDETIIVDFANTILESDKTIAMSQEILDILENGLSYSLHAVFWGVCTFAIITFVLTIFLPKSKSLYKSDAFHIRKCNLKNTAHWKTKRRLKFAKTAWSVLR